MHRPRQTTLLTFLLLAFIGIPLFSGTDETRDPAVRDRDRLLPATERDREPEFGGIINLRYAGDPRTLNNLMRSDGIGYRVCLFLCPRFLQLHPDTYEFVPFTASGLPEVSEDRLRYTWRIREGLKWEDFEESGAYVTAEDVKFSFDLIKNPDTACPGRSDFEHLTEIRVLDRYRFEAVYDKPSVDAVYKLGHDFRIMPKHLLSEVPAAEIANHPIGRRPVGFGPFKFHHWTKNKEILLVRNDMNRDLFPELFRPHVDGVRLKIVPDADMVWNLFLRGEIDICTFLHDNWKYRTTSDEFTKIGTRHFYYLPYWCYLAWNNDKAFFNDARVRRAMTHLMRRHEILESHFYGLGKVLSGPFWYSSRAYDRSIAPLPFDPEKAKRLLAEAGWEDGDGDGILEKGELKFEFELFVSTSMYSFLEPLLMAFQQDVEKAGIVMNIRKMEWSALKKLIDERSYDALPMAYRNYPVFEDPYQYWHSSLAGGPGNNRPDYRNPDLDHLLEEIRLEYDEAKRYALLRKVHGILHEEQPATFLYSLPSLVGINNRWRNVKIHNTGCFYYEWWLPSESRKSSDEIPR